MTDLAWQDNAACAEVSPVFFFPEDHEGSNVRHARKICGTCPVAAACLEYAVTETSIQHGVWGGLTVREIRHVRKARQFA